MTITADIEDLSVADFMMLLAQGQKTGRMTVVSGRNRLTLAFRNGDIVYASSTGTRETVGAMLVHRDLISEQQLDEALTRQNKQEGPTLLGQILMEMDAVTPEELNRIVFLQFQNVMRDALSWKQGVGTYEPMEIPDLGQVRVDPHEVMLETGFRAEQVLLGGAAEHDKAIQKDSAAGEPTGVRSVLEGLKEESLIVTSEMAAVILDYAARLVKRAILFLVCPDSFSVVGGFDDEDRNSALSMAAGHRIARQETDDSVISWVIDEARSYRGRLKHGEANKALVEMLGDLIPNEVIVIPFVVDGKVAAVLYGDNGSEKNAIGNSGELERVVARVAREMANPIRDRD